MKVKDTILSLLNEMIFCQLCNNMMFIQIDEDKKHIVYACKNCCHVQEQNSIVITSHVSDQVYGHKNNKNSKSQNKLDESIQHDPTLPITKDVKCETQDCVENGSKVIYVKTDAVSLKYTYFCKKCKCFWEKK